MPIYELNLSRPLTLEMITCFEYSSSSYPYCLYPHLSHQLLLPYALVSYHLSAASYKVFTSSLVTYNTVILLFSNFLYT